MKKFNIIIMLIVTFALNAQALFEVKDASDNAVLEVAQDGLRIFNQGDTLMVISSSEIKAFVDGSTKDKGLSRSFSVSTSATGKGGGDDLMKISNNPTFETVNDSIMLWYKQKNAFRVGYVLIADPNDVGQGSFASGYQSQAKGNFSSAIGYKTSADGKSSFASGTQTVASGENSCAVGNAASASNTNASSFGNGSLASGINSTALGTDAIASGSSSFAAGNRSEAAGPNSAAIGLFCKASGDQAIAFGSILTHAIGDNSTAIGMAAQASGANSTAIGTLSAASATYSTALGYSCAASGYASTAFGYNCDATSSYASALGGNGSLASGSYSTTSGYSNIASGYGSLAMGFNTAATGNYSTALGYNTTAQPYASFVVGRYNSIGGDLDSWVSTDALFIVGNGSSSTSRSNAFKVEKDGTVWCSDAYTRTSSYSKSDLKVDSRGLLCVLGKEEKGYDDQDIVNLIKENKELSIKVEELRKEIEEIKELLK